MNLNEYVFNQHGKLKKIRLYDSKQVVDFRYLFYLLWTAQKRMKSSYLAV